MTPRIRASYAKELVSGIESLPERTAIRARIEPAVFQRVIDTPGLSLVDGADHQALLEAAFAELDAAAYVGLIRKQTGRYRDSPLIGSTVRTLIKLLGSSPHGMLKHLPRLRDVTVQGYGTLSYSRVDDTEAHFALRGYPAMYMTQANMQLFVATFLGALDILGVTGDATTSALTPEERKRGDAEFSVTWR